MKKLWILAPLILLGLLITSWIVWENRARIAAHYISKHLHVPTKINSLEIDASNINIDDFWVGTPIGSKTRTSFFVKDVDVSMNLKRALKNPLIIDQIDMKNILIGIEYYEDGSTNWDYILQSAAKEKGIKGNRDYLIKTLVIENLKVTLTNANGSTKSYPTIGRMVFHNISNETGFPVEEIEKAIFNLIMQDIFQKFDLLRNIPGSPLRYLPGLFGK